MQVNIHEAKTNLSRLLALVNEGEEVIIAKSGKPIARLSKYSTTAKRQLGRDKGLYEIPGNFDDPLSEDVLKDFEGKKNPTGYTYLALEYFDT
jgi:prevent-host-death family protein